MVEGHLAVREIRRLLREKPKAIGLNMTALRATPTKGLVRAQFEEPSNYKLRQGVMSRGAK